MCLLISYLVRFFHSYISCFLLHMFLLVFFLRLFPFSFSFFLFSFIRSFVRLLVHSSIHPFFLFFLFLFFSFLFLSCLFLSCLFFSFLLLLLPYLSILYNPLGTIHIHFFFLMPPGSWASQDGELYLGEKNLRGVTGTPKLEDDGGPSKLQGPPFGRKND